MEENLLAKKRTSGSFRLPTVNRNKDILSLCGTNGRVPTFQCHAPTPLSTNYKRNQLCPSQPLLRPFLRTHRPQNVVFEVVSTKLRQVAIAADQLSHPRWHMRRAFPAGFSLCTILVLSFLLLPFAPGAAAAGPQQAVPAGASPADVRPILVELFTSEGCSSCPPADALLQKMDTLQPVAGAQLIVLSEHVDYWDHDGWKDPHSSAALTERQAAYVSALGLKTAYTPQMIVDGTTDVRANDPQQLNKVFHEAREVPKIPIRITDVSVDPGNPAVLHAHIQTDPNNDKHSAGVFVAVALDHVESQVLHGENGGQHLTHVAVVVDLDKVGKLEKGKPFDQTVTLKLKSGIDPRNLRVVAFLQESGPGKLLGAAVRKPS